MNIDQKKIQKTPLDIKIVSVFFVFYALAYFDVKSFGLILFGIVISGIAAQVFWTINSIILIICAYGFWKRKIFAWRLAVIFNIYIFLNWIFNILFISQERRVFINNQNNSGEQSVIIPAYENFYSILLIILFILFMIYLFNRKKLFVSNN